MQGSILNKFEYAFAILYIHIITHILKKPRWNSSNKWINNNKKRITWMFHQKYVQRNFEKKLSYNNPLWLRNYQHQSLRFVQKTSPTKIIKNPSVFRNLGAMLIYRCFAGSPWFRYNYAQFTACLGHLRPWFWDQVENDFTATYRLGDEDKKTGINFWVPLINEPTTSYSRFWRSH